jgi:hypothetical protein
MRIATQGIHSATTVGFHPSATAIGALIAPTLISLISIILVAIFATRLSSHEELVANRYFDPGDVLHLISAASAGGMQTTTFPPFNQLKDDSCENVRIKLGSVKGVDGSRIGFIDADE